MRSLALVALLLAACSAPPPPLPPARPRAASVAAVESAPPRLVCEGTEERLTVRGVAVDLHELVAEVTRVTGRGVHVSSFIRRSIDVDVEAAPWTTAMRRIADAAELNLVRAGRYTALTLETDEARGRLLGHDDERLTLRLDDGRALDLWLPAPTGWHAANRAVLLAALEHAREGDELHLRLVRRPDGRAEALAFVGR